MSSCAACKGCASGCGSGPPIAEADDGRPLVIWDGECTFCRRWASRWYSLTGRTFAWTTLQKRPSHLSVERKALGEAIHLVEADGTHVRGAEAVATIMARGGVRRWPLWAYRHVPGVGAISEAIYRFAARHRSAADRTCRALMGTVEIPDTWLLTRRVFVRCMGLIWLAAFLSLGHQLAGLIGTDGLRPIGAVLDDLAVHAPDIGFMQLPTLQWFGHDALLETTWILGAGAAVCMVLGAVPLLAAAACWALYLSLVTAGGIFTGYQWDMLLLEAGLLAVVWSPWSLWLASARVRRPSRFIHWLIILLLVKLMVLSGWVKLASQDPVWADCSALSWHFWTQPLPWWPAWTMLEAPPWLLTLLCDGMFIVELWVPWLLLLPRIPRLVGALSIIALQLGIAATGNYGFFNWLTIVLALAAIDDAMLLLLWPRAIRHRFAVGIRALAPCWRRWPVAIAGLFVMSVGLPQWIWWSTPMPAPAARWTALWQPWHVASNYGLFSIMTRTRPEVILEWSDDGEHWTAIEFRYKPGPLDEAPAFCQPGMPRLDWQLWFDALSYERLHTAGVLGQRTAWHRFSHRQVLPDLVEALRKGSAQVRSLLLPNQPGLDRPQWLRWSLWHYRPAEQGPAWWTRALLFQAPPIRSNPI